MARNTVRLSGVITWPSHPGAGRGGEPGTGDGLPPRWLVCGKSQSASGTPGFHLHLICRCHGHCWRPKKRIQQGDRAPSDKEIFPSISTL